MAMCTECGSLYNMEDHKDHSCDILKVPKKGEEISFNGTKKDIKTKQLIK